MKFHMLMFMNAWMMLVLMKCTCQMQCLTLGCYTMYCNHAIHSPMSVLHSATRCLSMKGRLLIRVSPDTEGWDL